MAVTINLLPREHAISGSLGKMLKMVRMLNVILLSAFIIFATGMGAFFAYSSFQLKSISTEVAGLKSQIVAQEKTEQAIVLLKDRLAKIASARGGESSNKIFAKIEPFLAGIGPNSGLSELNIDPQKLSLSVVFRTNSDLSAFLKTLTSSEVFKSVTLTTFGYNPASGYLATFSIL